jgi:hypothetical protein
VTRSALALALAACLLLGCGGDVSSPWERAPDLEVDLRVSVTPTEVALLQPVTVVVDRFRRAGVEASFAPEFDADAWVEQSRVDDEERALGEGRWQRTTWTLLPVKGPGELRVPSLRVEAAAGDGVDPAAATSEAVVVLVTSNLAAEHGAAIEAPGAPFGSSTSWWLWGALAAVVAGLAAAVLLLRRRPRVAAPPAEVVVPAHARALRALLRWRSAPRASAAQVDAFYVGVSSVLRCYVEERFGIRAPERTTEEFLRELEGGDALARRHRAELERFLSQCDLVKFAAHQPPDAEHEGALARAEAFVQATRSDRAAPRGGTA